MKLKLIKYPVVSISKDLTIGKYYECKEECYGDSVYIVNDDVGDDHEVEKCCFEEQSSEWNGEDDLPPVGTVCEVFIPGRAIWKSVEIVAHVDGLALFRNGTGGIFHGFPSDHFRTIKSEEDKEIEELDKRLDEWMDNEDSSLSHYLYNLGYRKTK